MKKRLVYAAMPLFCASAVAAQKPAEAVDATQSGQIADIVVTAQKRSENSQNVPIAISAVTASTLDRIGVKSVADLGIAVPALNASNAAGRLTVSLRGIGTTTLTPGLDNPIALYIDGVYIASQVGSISAITNNVERIEVLKGPQGTLFGRNATGGLISVITKDPTNQFSGKFDLSYGRFQTIEGNAYIAGPISEKLTASLSFHDVWMGDGWGKDTNTGNDTYRVTRDLYTQGKLVFKPSDGSKLTLIGDYADQKSSLGTVTGGTGDIVGGFVQPDIGWDAHSSRDARNALKQGGVSLTLNQEIGGDLNFTSITAYRKNKFLNGADLDSLAVNIIDYDVQTRDRQFSQELQLSNASSGRLKWTVGAYLYRGKSEQFATPDIPWVRITTAGLAQNVDTSMKIKSEAGFAQATYEILDRTNLTLGGRYSHEKRSLYDTTQSLFPLGGAPSDGTIIPYLDDAISANVFTYRASIDHRFSPQVLAYASINTGFKSGGFNLPTPGSPAFRPEKLRAYEVGLKADLLNRHLRANIAGFYYDYTNIQVQKYEGVTFNTINGGKARSYGIEGDVTAILTDRLTLSAGGTWLSAKFTDFRDCPISEPHGGTPAMVGSCKGNLLPLAAKVAITANIDYAIDLLGGRLNLNGNIAYNSGFYTEVDNVIHQKRYALLGASANWTDPSDHYTVSVFGRNLTEQRVISVGITTAVGTRLIGYREPTIYGVRVGYKF